MADLYNLLEEVGQDPEESQQPSPLSSPRHEDTWEEDREHLELPEVLKEAAERRKHAPATPEAAEESEERMDLEDFQTKEDGVFQQAFDKLHKLWSQELTSPELLVYDEAMVQTIMEALQRQQDVIDELHTAGRAGSLSSGNANIDALMASVLTLDADRVKFLLANWLKERLHKIQAHPLYMREQLDRMSDTEVEFLKQYGMLLERHLHRTVLDHFPQDAWKKLDAPEMIDKPNLETYVFVKALDDVAIDNGTKDVPDIQHHEGGTCLIVRYSRVRDLFLQDKLELLL